MNEVLADAPFVDTRHHDYHSLALEAISRMPAILRATIDAKAHTCIRVHSMEGAFLLSRDARIQ